MIDTAAEEVITFAEAVRRLPSLRAGKRIAPSTIWRWYQSGCRSRSGQRVKLEVVQIGGTTCTSAEALARFFQKLSAPLDGDPQPAPARQDKKSRATTTLDAAGI
jgi:hypothetical protein